MSSKSVPLNQNQTLGEKKKPSVTKPFSNTVKNPIKDVDITMNDSIKKMEISNQNSFEIPVLEQNLLAKHSKEDFAEKNFFSGKESSTLKGNQINRVRELQENNDSLQREIKLKEKLLLEATDPLTILADIEHCNIMLARNTGEILKIYAENEVRMKRIAELEEKNSELQNELINLQGKFITTHDNEQRTKCALDFFLCKAKIENNFLKLSELN